MRTQTKAYQAYAPGIHTTAETPAAAAMKFFASYPTKRKCSVIEGESDGIMFSVTYDIHGPRQWRDVTKKTANTLQ